MMHLFINALAASTGGGLTYVRNVVPHLAARCDLRATILVTSSLRKELGYWENICFIERPDGAGAARRFWHEQRHVAALARRSRADVLICAGNFALWNSPVPQILLSRNSLYTSQDFRRDLRARGHYRLWLDTHLRAALARMSIEHADCTVAPSMAFAGELKDWAGFDVVAIHHGFDHDAFVRDRTPLPANVQRKLVETNGALRLLFVSHHNYYRNFQTLIRAVSLLRKKLGPRKVRLILTCRLRSQDNPGFYCADSDALLVQQLGVSEEVVELGAIPYGLLYQLYQSCDLYVTPAYAESFAHPLVEAMASGLPVLASDLPVHREICGEAALYFNRFSPQQLADRLCALANLPELRRSMKQKGQRRSNDFSWSKHVDELLSVANTLVGKCVAALPRQGAGKQP